MRNVLLGVVIAWVPALVAQAQVGTRPAGAATQPAGIDEPFSARVIEVVGKVSYARPGDAAPVWTPAKAGDVLPAGTRVRTQIRSRLGLAFGDDTVVVIERATLASIDEFHRAGDTKRVRLGLGHGTIRAGVAETTLRSDMTIETPTATLSKRGTQDFGISYEPSSGRYRIWLAGEGLVEAFNQITGQSRLVRPGQYATQAMLRWIETRLTDRWVPVVDVYGTTELEKVFHAANSSGLGVVETGGGRQILTMSVRDGQQLLGGLQGGGVPVVPPIILPSGQTVIPRPEGNFGTGRPAGSGSLRSAR